MFEGSRAISCPPRTLRKCGAGQVDADSAPSAQRDASSSTTAATAATAANHSRPARTHAHSRPSSCIPHASSPTALEAAHVILACATLTVVPFLPACNLLAPVGFVLAERVLYLPSVGVCLLAAWIATTAIQCVIVRHGALRIRMTVFVKTWTPTTCLLCEHVNALGKLVVRAHVSQAPPHPFFCCSRAQGGSVFDEDRIISPVLLAKRGTSSRTRFWRMV